jgi:hypothetical protein
MDFLATMTTHVPQGTTEDTVAEVRQREAAHSHKLAERGSLRRCGGPRCGPASGALWASSLPTTPMNPKACSRRCRCGSGAATR